MQPLLREEEMDVLDCGTESDHDLLCTEMLEDICDRSQSLMCVNLREAHYKIRDRIKQRKLECKVALKATRNTSKGLHKVFKTVVKEICKNFHLWENLVQKFPISLQNVETLLKLQKFHIT